MAVNETPLTETPLTETIFMPAPPADDARATVQFNLGVSYARGTRVARDWSKAAHFFRLAAEQGFVKAQHNLGVCCERGEGVAQDWAEAARYFRLAAAEGDADAQCNLGVCYERGEGVAQDWAEAVRCYRLAAAQADVLSSEQLVHITAACERIACDREVAAACCLGCGARRKLKTCARCHVARFCGADCVARAWPAHKPNCKLWRDG